MFRLNAVWDENGYRKRAIRKEDIKVRLKVEKTILFYGRVLQIP